MSELTKRSTIYLNPSIYKALKLKAVETSQSISKLVNEAIKQILGEDFDDLQAFEERANEPSVSFESFVKELREDGKI